MDSSNNSYLQSKFQVVLPQGLVTRLKVISINVVHYLLSYFLDIPLPISSQNTIGPTWPKEILT